MKVFINEKYVIPVKYKEYYVKELLGKKDGCLAGCRTGILIYTQEEYKQGGVHNDQEGFFVLSGSGSAIVGSEEFSLQPGVCFIVPPGEYHSIKKDTSCSCIKLFFFHAAA
ncbi:MAG: cupin domain-containing protein [Atribacterota bacterium]|nr:cupin domain-containing protein [Atribacterota bacterium]MDD5637246.1 cupin domain-containing protein [Atribacterota bacterium]